MVPTPTVLTDGATVTWTMDNTFPRQQAVLTLTGDHVLDLESLQSGMSGTIKVIQDGSGSHTLSPGGSSTNFVTGGATTLTLSAAANAVDVWSWLFVSPNVYWSKGYSFQGWTTTDYASQSITYGKLQSTTAAGIILGRSSGSTGSPQELTPGSGLIVSSTYVQTIGHSMFMDILTALGSSYKGCTLGYDPFIANTANKLALASGTLRFVPIMFHTNFTATGVGILLETQGNFTGDATNSVALFSDSSGTLSKIAETANDPNIWKAATTTSTKWPFASTVAVNANQVYWLGLLYHQSAEVAAPALPAPVAVNSVMGVLDAGTRYIGHISAAGSQPTSQARSGFSTSAGIPFVLVY